MSSPTSYPGRAGADGDRLSSRTILVAVAVGVLTFGGIVGGGRALSGGRDYSAPTNTNQVQYSVPASGWANGAEQTWTTTIAADAQVMTIPGHLLTLVAGDDATNATLTAYAVTDSGRGESTSGITESWSTTIDASKDAGDTSDDFDITVKPAYLKWGENTLIHDTTLYDLDTGATHQAPWSSSDGIIIADDVAIACTADNQCTAYQESSPDASLWTQTADYATDYLQTIDHAYATVFMRDGQRYCNIGYREIYNVDTGERVELSIPKAQDEIVGYAATSASDGWIIRLQDTRGIPTVYAYGPDGGKPVDFYTDQYPLADHEFLLGNPTTPPSLADFKERFANKSNDTLLGLVSADTNDCVQSVEIMGRGTIDVPDLGTEPSCLTTIRIAADRSVVTAGPATADTQDMRTFRVMYGVEKGNTIDFPGMDTNSGALFDLVASDYVIGYAPTTGTLTGYRPAS
ncbi:hypothetical protein [Actinomyces sp. MRS3W]|uniref:hypothetical protein n=1 Tax=Actinomyces sp. MRS3W TaxID=2800796 RepID=UPI0028FCFF53|nr:hypothetical protein [Actinomyces sp. MRS3W]MDU0349780.1 hypothetical protein [Actinomyces sp. MRS3W]